MVVLRGGVGQHLGAEQACSHMPHPGEEAAERRLKKKQAWPGVHHLGLGRGPEERGVGGEVRAGDCRNARGGIPSTFDTEGQMEKIYIIIIVILFILIFIIIIIIIEFDIAEPWHRDSGEKIEQKKSLGLRRAICLCPVHNTAQNFGPR